MEVRERSESNLEGMFMFLHIGQHEIIPLDSIVAILNAKLHMKKKNNYWMLQKPLKNSHVMGGKIKSIIIMDTGEIYFSHIGSETLRKRIQKTEKAETSKRLKVRSLKH